MPLLIYVLSNLPTYRTAILDRCSFPYTVALTSLILKQFTKTSLYLLMRHISNCDILCFVVDGVEGLMGLQAEGGDGKEDEEERAKRHILQREKQRGVLQFYNLHIKHTSSPLIPVTLKKTVTSAHRHFSGPWFKPSSLVFRYSCVICVKQWLCQQTAYRGHQ